MDPHRLRLLRELGDRGSVTAVAAAMHVSPSAVSQQLAALQAASPARLTVRRGRTLVLTEAGRALAVASARVDAALVEALGAIDGFLDTEDQVVTVSAFHSAGLALFRPLLTGAAGAPRVALADADVAGSDFPSLTADHDLVVAHRLPHDAPWPTERLIVTPLLVEALDVALHADDPLAAQAEVHPEQLRGRAWVSTREDFPLAGVLTILGASIGEPPVVAHRINEFFVAAEVVRSGTAIAIMPRRTGAALAVDGMVLRPVAGVRLARHVDVLARPDALARASVRSVLAELRRAASRLDGPAEWP